MHATTNMPPAPPRPLVLRVEPTSIDIYSSGAFRHKRHNSEPLPADVTAGTIQASLTKTWA